MAKRGRQWSLKRIMQTPTKEIPANQLYTVAYLINGDCNKRIAQLEKNDYCVIKNSAKYNIGKNNRFLDVRKDRDSASYRRIINDRKSFINSPSNSYDRVKDEYKRLKKKYPNEKITEDDFRKFRAARGRIWEQMDEFEKTEQGIGSKPMEISMIRHIKQFKTFKAQLRHVLADVETAKNKKKVDDFNFEEDIRKVNNQ